MAGKKIKDTEYLYLSAYVHAKENNMIGAERIERMLASRSPEEALKVLDEAGWSPEDKSSAALEKLLSHKRDEAFADMGKLAPNVGVVDMFRIRYDYHNAKVLIKSSATGTNASELLSGAGRYSPEELKAIFVEGRLSALPKIFADAIAEANDTLARTGDPQLADFILDKAYYEEYIAAAKAVGSDFLMGYARLSVDCANLRSLVRSFRMKKDEAFIKRALLEGGNVKCNYIIASLASPEAAIDLYSSSALAQAAAEGKAIVNGGKLSEFERLCDNVLNRYIADAKLSAFGEKPLIGYLCAVEAEIKAIRIVMAGQYAGIPADTTRKRLREGL